MASQIAEEKSKMQKSLKDFDLYHLYKNWYNGCGMFECFVHSTPFVTLKNYPDFELAEVDFEQDDTTKILLHNISAYIQPDTLLMFDLDAKSALKAAFFLQQEWSVKPVLTFRQINHPYGLVFEKDIISSFLLYSERITEKNENGFAFILDFDRYGEFTDELYQSRFNNQYEITEYELPVCEMLKDMGYKRLVFFHQDSVKEDMEPYLDYLEKSGIQVLKVRG